MVLLVVLLAGGAYMMWTKGCAASPIKHGSPRAHLTAPGQDSATIYDRQTDESL